MTSLVLKNGKLGRAPSIFRIENLDGHSALPLIEFFWEIYLSSLCPGITL